MVRHWLFDPEHLVGVGSADAAVDHQQHRRQEAASRTWSNCGSRRRTAPRTPYRRKTRPPRDAVRAVEGRHGGTRRRCGSAAARWTSAGGAAVNCSALTASVVPLAHPAQGQSRRPRCVRWWFFQPGQHVGCDGVVVVAEDGGDGGECDRGDERQRLGGRSSPRWRRTVRLVQVGGLASKRPPAAALERARRGLGGR